MFEKLFPTQFDDQGYVLFVWRAIGPLVIAEDRYPTFVVRTTSLFGRIISPLRYFGWPKYPKVNAA